MELLYEILVRKVWICWLGNPPNSLSLSMFGFEEPYLCIKVIFVRVSSALWLVLGFGWKFRVKRGKLAEIEGEYQYSKLFLV